MVEFILMYNLIMQQGDNNIAILAQYKSKAICEKMAKNNEYKSIYGDYKRTSCIPTHIPIKK